MNPVRRVATAVFKSHRLPLVRFWNTRTFCQVQEKEDMDQLKKNPYYAKYAMKLKSMEENKPDDFKTKLDELEKQKEKEKENARKDAEEARAEMEKQAAPKPNELNSIMKIELLEDKTEEEITEIWKDYHSKKCCIYGVISKDEYQEIHRRLTEFPTFLYPLPRQNGYEFFLQQTSGRECHFTPLIAFQTRKENAPSCLTTTHYTELMDSKGIVLMRGELDEKILSVYEAQLLALQVKMFYGLQSGLRFNMVRMFNNDPAQFQHADLLREFENYKKDCKDIKSGFW